MSQQLTGNLALENAVAQIKYICEISEGRSQYFPYGGAGYMASVSHYFESSTEDAYAAVQPGSVEDLQSIVKIIAETRVPFAIKCGGHATNPGFSSTEGIQIYLVRLNKIVVHKKEKLVDVGAGCLFEELHQALAPHGLDIVGGTRWAGVGVTGWILGGGYSIKTSQYGLGVDNIAAAKLVLPNGDFAEASETKNPDLFFAIKGGGNNFGIVTELTLKAHEQGEFHNFMLNYKPECFNEAKKTILNALKKRDNRANIGVKFRHYGEPCGISPEVLLTVQCVYDGAYPSKDPFAELKNVPHSGNEMMEDPGHVALSDLPKLGYPKPPVFGMSRFPRGRWGNVMVDKFTPVIIEEIEIQSYEAAKDMMRHGGTNVTIGLWPFTEAMFDNATPSAWPHEKGRPSCPISVYLTWEGKQNDAYWINVMKKTLDAIRECVFRERPASKDLPSFINAASAETTTAEDIYRGNLDVLKQLRKKYDEHGVMDLAGGFRIPRAA